MNNLITNTNSKIKHTNQINDSNIYEFNLPAYQTKKGKIVCPFADDCVEYCYADKGTYLYPNVQNKYNNNYEITKQDNFIELIQNEINKKNPSHIRLHSSGDFYNIDYLLKWLVIADNNPDVIFYCYTKSIPFFKNRNIRSILSNLNNFIYTFSTGSKKDNLININFDRHAKIFNNEFDLLKDGYINASKNDLIAINPDNKKIGLIYH